MKANKLQQCHYDRYVTKLRKKLKNKNVSIISNNCIGGILYHDLGIKFNSPTINTLIYGQEFVIFCNHLKEFLSCELQYDESSKDYPIGILKLNSLEDKIVHVHFLHDKTFSEAKEKWDRRKTRFDENNYGIIYEHFNKNDDDIVYDFCKINHPYKIVFTHKPFKDVVCSYYCHTCRKEKSFGTITKFQHAWSGKRNIYKSKILNLLNNCRTNIAQ